LASIKSVHITADRENEELLHWQLYSTRRDLARKENRDYTTFGILNTTDFSLTKSPHSSDATNEVISAFSNCGKLRAVIMKTEKDPSEQILEVFKGPTRVASYNLKNEGVHGLVHNNPMFGCIEWSNDSTRFLYIAEKEPISAQKKFSFLDNPKSMGNGDTKKDRFLWEDNWGEQLTKCKDPTICIFDLKQNKFINLSEYLPKNISVSRAYWSKDDNFLILTGFKSEPWKLGLIYCRNRPSGVYALSFKDMGIKTVIDTKDCVYSLTISPDRSRIFYLQTQALGPHAQCARLMMIGIGSQGKMNFGSPSVTYDFVKKAPGRSSFQGLFIRDSFPTNCWLSEKIILFHSQFRSNVGLFAMDVDHQTVFNLEIEGDWRVMMVKNPYVFAVHSLPNQPQTFKIGKVKKNQTDWSIDWITVDEPSQCAADFKWNVLYHKPTLRNPQFPEVQFESILVTPQSTENLAGLIVNPHGGPHGAWSTGFDLTTACFARLNFAVLRVNYRGSTGFSQNGIDSLLGNIGTQDVADCHQATITAMETLTGLDPKNVFVKGGSHGGFLTLHLIAQHPNLFSAAIARNPVSNVVANACASDIPDWSYCEGGLIFNHTTRPDSEKYSKMLQMSPIAIAGAIQAPLMLMVGSDDKRVPPYQSFELARVMKGLSKKVKVLMYEGNDHRIAEVEAEADSFINSALWCFEHMAERAAKAQRKISK